MYPKTNFDRWWKIKPTPYEEGMAAAKRPWTTWFDCPYTERDPDSRNKYREWMAGWDFIKQGQP